jgi:hypothetical protein
VGDMMDGGGNGHVRWSECRIRSASINGAPQNCKPPIGRRTLLLGRDDARRGHQHCYSEPDLQGFVAGERLF